METGSANAQPTVWLVRAGRKGRYANDFVVNGVVAVGWPAVGDARGRSRSELRESVALHYGEKGAAGTAGVLYRFANEMRMGDLVITPDPETRELHVGTIIGDYEFREPAVIEGYPDTRTVVWRDHFSRDKLPKRILYQLGSLITLSTPSAQDELRAYLTGKAAPESVEDETEEGGSEEDPSGGVDLYEEQRERFAELIRAKIAVLDAYETQDLVAGILRAMGYATQVAREGPDGGVDVLASREPLAVEPPIIKVQVKARPNTSAPASDIRELAGLLAQDERGVFVSTGGFTREAQNDAKVSRIALVGMGRLLDLLLTYYEDLDQDTKSLVALRRLYVP